MKRWIIENEKVKLAVDKKRGVISSFLIKNKKIDILDGEIGYVAMEDGLKKKIFGEKAKIIEAKMNKEKTSVFFKKSYPEADFIIKEEIRLCSEEVKWIANASLEKGDSRTINIYFVFPCLKNDSHLFVSHSDAPLSPEKFSRKMYIYGGDQFRGELRNSVLLPLITIYHPNKDYGISISQPVDLPKPQLQYFLIKAKADLSCIVKYCYLGLRREKDAKAEIDFFSHQGDWRPGLKYMLEKYPEYFAVEGKSIYKSEGAMLCSTLHSEKEIKDWKKNGFTWQEIHQNIYPIFGIFVPKEESWKPTTEILNEKNLDLRRVSQTKSVSEFRGGISAYSPPKISKRMIKDYIRLLHKNKTASFIYFNPVLCFRDYSHNFSDSITEGMDGRPIAEGYYFSYAMNPDPKYSWGKYLINQIEKLMDTYPEVDGLFFDEIHYRGFDFAHNDGVTMVDNRVCSMMGFGMEKLIQEVCDIIHQRGKSVWANGATSLEVIKHIDGFMAEGASWWYLGSVQYLGLIHPLVALQQTRDVKKIETVLKYCLITGAQPSVPWRLEGEKGISGESKETKRIIPDTRKETNTIFSRYQLLLNLIKKREWVLEPHCLTLPSGVKGNIFKVKNDYVVTIVNMSKSIFDAKVKGEKIKLRIKLPDTSSLKKAYLFSADDKSKKEIDFAFERETINITFVHKIASLILLSNR